jgi:HNH endonuclease
LRIDAELRAKVAHRAGFRCEYCLLHEQDAGFAHEVDHIIGRQHGGETADGNLAYACLICNRFKGPNLSSVDSSGAIIPLFHPRLQRWADHFRLTGAVIQPLTATGEATANLLRLNAVERVVERSVLQRLNRYPLQK